MVADVNAEVAAHPSIIRKVSIGRSYQGRTIWAVKISDNVTVDENEPEVLFDGLTHSDEHMGLEMTLHIMHWLVDGYGHDSRITTLVNAREVWIVLAVNPDGAEYDISGGKFHFWRKNRQPNAGTSAIGTDINRNFGYRWGIAEGRTSTNPAAITYMGPKAFSTPEARNIRDFLASRVVNGRQQIRAAITFHESGRLVMWPYGYTYADRPADMTVQDHDALVKLGRLMASTNGYRPEQASDLYLTSGTTRDYEYGTYRIFSYTFELSVKDYPDDSLIASETGRNKAAVLDLINWASCPVGILGLAVRTVRCGVFDDDFEVNRGWVRNADGTDSATSGLWSRTAPQATSTAAGRKQPSAVTSGRYGMVTGRPRGERQRQRRGRRHDVGDLAAVHAHATGAPEAPVPLHVRPRPVRVVGRRVPRPGGRRRGGDADHGLGDPRGSGRAQRDVDLRVGRPERVRRQDDPARVRRDRRGVEQPGRGRVRRRPGHPAAVRADAVRRYPPGRAATKRPAGGRAWDSSTAGTR
jgi:hypothetical protein